MFSNQSIVIGVHPSSQLISFEILSRCCYIFEDLFVCFVKKLHISAKKVLQIITRIFSSNAFEFNRKMKKEKKTLHLENQSECELQNFNTLYLALATKCQSMKEIASCACINICYREKLSEMRISDAPL